MTSNRPPSPATCTADLVESTEAMTPELVVLYKRAAARGAEGEFGTPIDCAQGCQVEVTPCGVLGVCAMRALLSDRPA